MPNGPAPSSIRSHKRGLQLLSTPVLPLKEAASAGDLLDFLYSAREVCGCVTSPRSSALCRPFSNAARIEGRQSAKKSPAKFKAWVDFIPASTKLAAESIDGADDHAQQAAHRQRS